MSITEPAAPNTEPIFELPIYSPIANFPIINSTAVNDAPMIQSRIPIFPSGSVLNITKNKNVMMMKTLRIFIK